jgi:branched-chain amino acid transport system ATP-binding protein
MGILEVEKVTKSFGENRVLDSVDMSIATGKITILIGPNGSGKSTLINVITGLLKPDSGHVFFDGQDVTGWPPHKLFNIGVARTFQVPRPFRELTVAENLLTASRRNPGETFTRAMLKSKWIKEEREATERASTIIHSLSLGDVWMNKGSDLSGGQMKLVEIGRALMSGAKVVLMDEPVAGVNPTLAEYIFTQLRRLNRDMGITFLIIEHRLDLALPYVDYLYAMARGTMVASGTPEKVLSEKTVIETYLGR